MSVANDSDVNKLATARIENGGRITHQLLHPINWIDFSSSNHKAIPCCWIFHIESDTNILPLVFASIYHILFVVTRFKTWLLWHCNSIEFATFFIHSHGVCLQRCHYAVVSFILMSSKTDLWSGEYELLWHKLFRTFFRIDTYFRLLKSPKQRKWRRRKKEWFDRIILERKQTFFRRENKLFKRWPDRFNCIADRPLFMNLILMSVFLPTFSWKWIIFNSGQINSFKCFPLEI